MRMWMVDPKVLCKQHLLGEHNETHAIASILNKEFSIDGYIRNGLIEPRAVKERHDILVIEMKRRGMNHDSPLNERIHIDHLPKEQQDFRINKEHSISILFGRCALCRERRGYLESDDKPKEVKKDVRTDSGSGAGEGAGDQKDNDV